MLTRAPNRPTSPRDRLLGAAIGLFDRKGYAATAVREIAEAAAVTKPTLYYHFGSKEGIFVAILDRAREAFSATLDEAAAVEGSARARLHALADRVFALMEDNVVVVRLMHATYYGPREGAPPFDFELFHHRLLEAVSGLVADGMRVPRGRRGGRRADPARRDQHVFRPAAVASRVEPGPARPGPDARRRVRRCRVSTRGEGVMTGRCAGSSVAALVAALVLLTASHAFADFTAFLGTSATPENRSAKGFAVGVGLLVVGFEFEYASTAESLQEQAPSLRTGMGNVLFQTPVALFGFRPYFTTGAGLYRERLETIQETSVGLNTGGGVKISLLGPVRARIDYRVFKLRGEPLHPTVHRTYVGLNLAF
jgi:AcrR family transcriptional regulator